MCVRANIRYSHDTTPLAMMARGILCPPGKNEVDIACAKSQIIRQIEPLGFSCIAAGHFKALVSFADENQ